MSAALKDYLQDIVKNTYGLGIIDLVKITGTTEKTQINAIAEDKTVVISAETHDPIAEFIGLFGMPNLSKLNTILNISEYKEDPVIRLNTQTKDDEVIPVGLHFENKTSDFVNDYRFMNREAVTEKVKKLSFKEPTWHVEFSPTVANINRLKMQASANTDETTFIAKTENKNLVLYFGDHSTHAGNFVFEAGVSGTISNKLCYPVAQIISILNLSGDKTFKISNDGAIQIVVDSGLAKYTYTLTAQSK